MLIDDINRISIPNIKTAIIDTNTNLSSYGTIYGACVLNYPGRSNYPGYFAVRMYTNTFAVFQCYQSAQTVEYVRGTFSIGIIYS